MTDEEKEIKKAQLQKHLENENVQWLMYNIMRYEAHSHKVGGKTVINYGGFEQGAQQKGTGYYSSAHGLGQFTGNTRSDILSSHGVDAWSENLEEQQLAILALIDKDGHMDHVLKGDFKNFSAQNTRWQAFYTPDTKDYKEAGNRRGELIGKKPKTWKSDYNNYLETAVYDPTRSWNNMWKGRMQELLKQKDPDTNSPYTEEKAKKLALEWQEETHRKKLNLYKTYGGDKSYGSTGVEGYPSFLQTIVDPEKYPSKKPVTGKIDMSGFPMDPITSAQDKTKGPVISTIEETDPIDSSKRDLDPDLAKELATKKETDDVIPGLISKKQWLEGKKQEEENILIKKENEIKKNENKDLIDTEVNVEEDDDKIKPITHQEIKDSIARGEASKWNIDPRTGDQLDEGYTYDYDLEKIVWVGEGPDPKIKKEDEVVVDDTKVEEVDVDVEEKNRKIREKVAAQEAEEQRIQKEKDDAWEAEQTRLYKEGKVDHLGRPIKKKKKEEVVVDKTEVKEDVVIEGVDAGEPYQRDGKLYRMIDGVETEVERKDESAEVLDAKGNVINISIPTITPKMPDPKEIKAEKADDLNIEETVVEEPVTEELIKPEMKDFDSSQDYMRARMEYYKQLEEKGEVVDEDDDQEVILENELSEEELSEEYDLNNTENVNVGRRNVFNDAPNNLFDFISGSIKNILNKNKRSLNLKDSDEVTLVRGGFGRLGAEKEEYGFYREEITTTREALEADEKRGPQPIYITDADYVEGREIDLETKKEVIIKDDQISTEDEYERVLREEKEEEEEKERKSKLKPGDYYEENELFLADLNKEVEKNTIAFLAQNYPDNLIIENDVVKDNQGNVINNREDWVNFVSTPVEQGGLGLDRLESGYDQALKKFTTKKLINAQAEQDIINMAYEYLISSKANETGILFKDLFYAGENETLDFGKYKTQMKRHILNQMPMGEIAKLAKESQKGKPGEWIDKIDKFLDPKKYITTLDLPSKEILIANAKNKILEENNKFLNDAVKNLSNEEKALNLRENDLEDDVETFEDTAAKIQSELDILLSKYGKYNWDKSGKMVWYPKNSFALMSAEDKQKLKDINSSIVDNEQFRGSILKDREELLKAIEEYNEKGRVIEENQTTILKELGWNWSEEHFDPAFSQTISNENFDEYFKRNMGAAGDVGATFTGGWLLYKLLAGGKNIMWSGRSFKGLIRRGLLAPALGVMAAGSIRDLYDISKKHAGYDHFKPNWKSGGNILALDWLAQRQQKHFSDLEKRQEYLLNPLFPNKFNETGYTNLGMTLDMMFKPFSKKILPVSLDPKGMVVDPDFKSKHNWDAEAEKIRQNIYKSSTLQRYSPQVQMMAGTIVPSLYAWGGELGERILPEWAGGQGDWNFYSTSKSLAHTIPYVLTIREAWKGMPAKSKNLKESLIGGSSSVNKAFNYVGKKDLGLAITKSLGNSFIAKPSFLAKLNMIRINHKITYFDNYADGRARGLNPAQATAYGNFLSLATGISQSIMPDYLWFKTTGGKKIINRLLNDLKQVGLRSTGKKIIQETRGASTKAALKTAGVQFFKEHLEEQADVFFQDIVKAGFLTNHSWEIASTRVQADVLANTSILMLPMSSMSAWRTRQNVRNTVYREIRNNAAQIVNNAQQEIDVIKNKIERYKKLKSKKAKHAIEVLQTELEIVEQQKEEVLSINRAFNAAPNIVTDTQIELMIVKNKLLDKRKELNKKDKAANGEELAIINAELDAVNEQIENNGISKYKSDFYNALFKSATNLAGKLGVVVSHVVDEESYAKGVEVEKKRREDHNKRLDDDISKLRKRLKKAGDKESKIINKRIKAKEKQKYGNETITFDGPGFIFYDDITGKHHIVINEKRAKKYGNDAVILHELLHAVLRKTILNSPKKVRAISYMLRQELLKNPEKYIGVGSETGYVLGKTDSYQDEVNNMSFDELFTVFSEAMAQGNIRVDGNILTKIGDFVRRMFREIGINFTIRGPEDMVNFLRDYNNEVLSGRNKFSKGMMKIHEKGLKIQVSGDIMRKAEEFEKKMVKQEGLEFWDPKDMTSALSMKSPGINNIYKQKRLQSKFELGKNTADIVAENERIRSLILEKGLRKNGKIIADEELQDLLVQNNLPMAVALARFAANNPKIMGLEEGKRVTYEQFLSGYYMELSNLARTYDASVNEFGQYLNTILPRRFGQILEAEKKGAMEGAQGLDFVPDIIDDTDTDLTPDDVKVKPKVDTAERLGVKKKTKAFIDKGIKQVRMLQDLQVKISEEYNEETAEKIADLTSELESKGMVDLDIEGLTVKKAPNLLYKFVSELTGIDAEKLNPNSKKWLANLRKDDKRGSNEVRSAQRFVAEHGQLILSTVFNEGHTAAFKSSGMPKTLLKFGYNKGSKRINNNFPQYKKPNLSETDLLKYVGVEKQTVKGITGYKFTVDRNTGTKLLAIAQMVDRNMSLQGINEYLEESGDMTATLRNSIQDGLSNYQSKSIYYINSDVNIKQEIDEGLHRVGMALGKIDDGWNEEAINRAFENAYKDTNVNWKRLAKELTGPTSVVFRYITAKTNYKLKGGKFTPFKDFAKEQLEAFENQDYANNIISILGIQSVNGKKPTNGSFFTPEKVVRARTQVGLMVQEINDLVNKGKMKKKEALELIWMLEQQHKTASKVSDGSFEFEAGTNAYIFTGKKGNQRMQLFGSKEGATVDFRRWINTFLSEDLQIPETGNYTDIVLQTQNKTNAVKSITDEYISDKRKNEYSKKLREREEKLARKALIFQIKYFAKRLKDKQDDFSAIDMATHLLTLGSNMGTASRRAAMLIGIQDGIIIDGKYIGISIVYEHGKPHAQLIAEIISAVNTVSEANLEAEIEKILVDYKVNLITEAHDNTLTRSKRKSIMDPVKGKYKQGLVDGWTQRIFNEENMGDDSARPIRLIEDVMNKNFDGKVFGENHADILPKPKKDINRDRKISEGIQKSRSIDFKSKGITILDFDDTLATTKSLVKYTTPNGEKGTLNAEEYAVNYQDLLEKGYKFDFTEFNKVVDGKLAPLFQKALKLQKKFGPKNMFVLTARAPESQLAIFEFLQANGLNIPLENITGLGNSTSEAKALWIAEKVGEGYNDFYFADDALQNVQAVKNMLDQFDVKSKIQQAKMSKSVDYDNEFNEILEETSGVEAEKRFSEAKAKKRGADKGKWNIFIPPGAEDFIGLIYHFLTKGKKGEKQLEFFKKALIDPLNRAYRELNEAKQNIANNYKELQKKFPNIRKNMYKLLPGTEFTYGDAIRIYLWNRAGFEIPGLSVTDELKIVEAVESNPELKAYAEALSVISTAEEGYIEPNENWTVEDIRVDLANMANRVNRKKFFAEFLENVSIIFSRENLNKIEAIYGSNFREALEDMLYRIENGTNRSFGSNRLVNRFMNWINGSIGTTMFFNSRSSILQTLSTVNFINWSDNNVLAAAKAFANQKQFWADFSMIFNSSFLKQRRAGLGMDVNANEIANYVANSRNPVKAALNWLLQKGFLPTQIADSFAIAMGGATFYRNRVNTYLKQGMSLEEAQEKAFLEFQEIAEETQQSARPDKISQQQASVLGRIILAFQNTPMQYARLMKKAILDLQNGRGDAKTNMSKIVYYGFIQNLIFYSLQTALFAMLFGDDDDEEFFDKKKERVLNGSLDSVLRGMGVGGAVVSTVKNMTLKFIAEQDKPKWKKDENAVLMEMLNISPPIGIKARQVQMASRTLNWNEKEVKDMNWYNLDNPLWEAGFMYTQAITNVPLARMHTKVSNIREAANSENEAWQRLFMLGGWTKWNLGVKSKKKSKRRSKRRTIKY